MIFSYHYFIDNSRLIVSDWKRNVFEFNLLVSLKALKLRSQRDQYFSHQNIRGLSTGDSRSRKYQTIGIQFPIRSHSEILSKVLWRDAKDLHQIVSHFFVLFWFINISNLGIRSIKNTSKKPSINRTLIKYNTIFLVVSCETHNSHYCIYAIWEFFEFHYSHGSRFH